MCKAAAHGWCREVQCCELWSCCWAGRSSGCASTVWLLRLGLGGLMMGQDTSSSSCLTSSLSRKCRVGLGWLQSLHCACGMDADGTAAGRRSCRSKCCLCRSLVRLPAAAALSEVLPACLPPDAAAASFGSVTSSAPTADSSLGTYCHCPTPKRGC